ncbi:hypothetical protein EC991_000732 [Linnemannia zychae]|nr:hypothetical protein EC991_000732 [Linnemannia zychae]
MADYTLDYLDPQALETEDSENIPPRKKPRIHGSFSNLNKVNSEGPSQTLNAQYYSQQTSKSSSGVYQTRNESASTPPPSRCSHVNIFLENVPASTLKAELPRPHERITRTEQLLYCNMLLQQSSWDPPSINTGDKATEDFTDVLQEPLLDELQMNWLTEMKKEPVEQDHMRWLVARMVEEFVRDLTKDATEIAETVSLGPVLQMETYRKLLSSIIKEFDNARILNVQLLQGLIQLVQSAPAECLDSDDLVKILSVLRIHLQGTHQQSTKYSYHLTLAVSQVLDIMADHKACYAFQALQYVPNDEAALQAVWRHSTGVMDGLVKVSGVRRLDLNMVLGGLGSLQKVVVDVDSANSAYQSECTLLESGRGVFASLKDSLGTGHRRPWYAAVRAACNLARAGQFKDLNQLIYKAPCRSDPLFQWGICQLLAEIATDPIWEVSVRQQAVCLLGYLYKNDDDWARDESVKAWMLTIINKLAADSDKVVSPIALALQQELSAEESSRSQHPHPLTSRLSMPDSSPILIKVQRAPYVERVLHLMKRQLLMEACQPIYIPPMAKANLEACDDKLFPLMGKVREFLASEQQVMLILAIERPDKGLIAKRLRRLQFSEVQIQEPERHRQFILICDGYDESQLKTNLHTTNELNRKGQPDTKVIITCRTQYLGNDYRDRFVPQEAGHYNPQLVNLFQEAVITPFSKGQIKSYVDQYVPLEHRTWSTQDYMDRLEAIPDLMDLATNPFLLSLSLEALPHVTAGKQDMSTIKVSRIQLYDIFVHHWLDVNRRRLQRNRLYDPDRATLDDLLDAGFVSHGISYCTKLASTIFVKQHGNPIVQYNHLKDKSTWKAEFFGNDSQTRLLRDSTPLNRSIKQYQFLHKSMLEYFVSRAIYEPYKYGDSCGLDSYISDGSSVSRRFNADSIFFSLSLCYEKLILEFLSQRVSVTPELEEQLRDILHQWVLEHYDDDSDAPIVVKNAIYILISAELPQVKTQPISANPAAARIEARVKRVYDLCEEELESTFSLHRYPCPSPSCSRIYARPGDWKRHFNAVHLQPRWECSFCHKKFTRMDTYKHHARACRLAKGPSHSSV